jgi:adenylate cyclase
MADRAIEYLQIAGRAAYRMAANQLALSHFDQALALVEDLAPGRARDRHEMALQLGRTSPLLAMHGYAAPDVKGAARRVAFLAEELDEPDYLFAAQILLISRHCMLAEYHPALELGELLLAQAEKDHNPLHETQAHHFLGHVKFCSGSFAAALDHFDAALASHVPKLDSLFMSGFIGQNMWLTTLFRKAWTLWFLGCAEQSQAVLAETLTMVEELGREHDLAFTLAMGVCPLLCIQRQFEQAQLQTERLLELAARKGLRYFMPFGQVALGAIQANQGRQAEGVEKISAGIRAYRKGGQKTFLTYCLAVLADSLGDNDETGRILDQALALMEETGERFFEPELLRLQGEYLWHGCDDMVEGEACLQRAMVTARHQQAKSLQLRAATSLAQLWGRQNRVEEATQLLGQVYASFNEGFDSPDLRDARRLLTTLAEAELTPCNISPGHE